MLYSTCCTISDAGEETVKEKKISFGWDLRITNNSEAKCTPYVMNTMVK